MTLEGSHEVCVQGEPCIAAIHAYYQAFVQQGCAERLQLESTYKLAWSLERAADACLVVGEAAKIGHTKASVIHDEKTTGQSLTGCYHEFPACAPNCLLLPFTEGVPGGQRLNEIYSVGQTCYKAVTRCQGCLFKPSDNPKDLEPFLCPAEKCMQSTSTPPMIPPSPRQISASRRAQGLPHVEATDAGGVAASVPRQRSAS